MAKKSSGGTPALKLVSRVGVKHQVHSYKHDPAAASFGLEAAEKLGIDPARVFKTLVAECELGLVVGMVPVQFNLDLKALAAEVGCKAASMANPMDAERSTGYVAGGISPLGQKKKMRTVIDVSAQAHATIFVSAGRRGLELELAPTDLATLTESTFAQIAK